MVRFILYAALLVVSVVGTKLPIPEESFVLNELSEEIKDDIPEDVPQENENSGLLPMSGN